MSNKSTRPPLKVDETDLPQRKVVGPDGDDDLQILAAADQSVSYTHLTLPTSDLV